MYGYGRYPGDADEQGHTAKGVTHKTLDEIRDSLVASAKETETAEGKQIADRFLSEFVFQLKDRMSNSGTVFYQP